MKHLSGETKPIRHLHLNFVYLLPFAFALCNFVSRFPRLNWNNANELCFTSLMYCFPWLKGKTVERKEGVSSIFIKKDTLEQVFSCEFCEIFKNTVLTGSGEIRDIISWLVRRRSGTFPRCPDAKFHYVRAKWPR